MKTGFKKPKGTPKRGSSLESSTFQESEDILELADHIKRVFVKERAALYPGAPGCSKQYDVHFIRAAHLVLGLKETPEVFVRRQFDYLQMTGAALYPQAMGSPAVTKAARTSTLVEDKTDLLRYKLQVDRWATYAKVGSPEAILRTYGAEFSPLIRFVMETQYGLDTSADRAAARSEYWGSPIAQELFPDIGGSLK